MSINYRKIKSQIKRLKPEAKHNGHIFIPTAEQEADAVFPAVTTGRASKKRLISYIAFLANDGRRENDNEFTKHFAL